MKLASLNVINYEFNSNNLIVTFTLRNRKDICFFSFDLKNESDRERLQLLSSYYLNSDNDISFIMAKYLRVHLSSNGELLTICHPTEDRGFPLGTARVMEFTDDQFISFYKSQT